MTKKEKKNLMRIIAAVILVILCTVLKLEGYLRFAVYMAAYLIVGYDILKKAFKGILKKQIFDENFLMATATVGAVLLGEYTEAVAVMLFYQIGELFQSYAIGKSRRNISALMDIRPDYANVETDGKMEQIDPDEVEIGTVITVLPGERIPIDGIVVSGTSTLDTSALTGESVPRGAKEGDEVLSGCINMDGLLKISTTKEFGESTVARILDLVENASSKKSRSEQFISRFAHYYTPAVCYSALALAVIPPVVIMLMGKDPEFSKWIYRALTFLVISCPCALVISIPLSFFAGIGGASKNGILIKGSNYLEALSKVKTLVFDKTGTVTKGVFEVTEIVPVNISKEDLLYLTAYCENYSNHPIARSIKTAYGQDIDESLISDIQEISGHGVTAVIAGRKVACGNEKLMKRLGIEFEKADSIGTVVYVGVEDRYVGYITVSDVIKENAARTFSLLKNAGVTNTVMLTGDSKTVADKVAEKLKIDKVYSELLPDQKVAILEDIIKTGNGKVGFVGDGINDAPALTQADVGIAMGALGSDAAIEAADIVLMDDDIIKLVTAINIARKCIRIVYENIYFAIGIKLRCLVLGAIGKSNMWMAIFADVGVMVIAVINAIRTLVVKKV
ncbi:MAG: cadmium-translocating P-type ATPase [Erysipelotrichaceae bacterium]|nr:cadmium-translocating P-type ATPase [Erysipelotrichaceae bacterium]